ncbi:MAG: hypothetical protein Q9190_003046 [Brigantiaea leucoxantha]
MACSLYGEIGQGDRVALSKLSVEHFEKLGRPLRIAIDASIWSFQTQSGKGGTNPALRTLYYRILRLLSICVQPLFIFDGPNKPPFKRNTKTGGHGAALLPNFLTKELLKLFGLPYHTAPGEAEAECALLQKEGIVDAVLSEDADTMMFGCTVQLRSWSCQGTKGNRTPTHVNVYRAESIKDGKIGLNREGIILIALMSGGDYSPAGVPRCGIKLACEAARAGFGLDLCRLSRNDSIGLNQWKERLEHELKSNESGFFRMKHKKLIIPATFPDKVILKYYMHPAVSNSESLNKLRSEIHWRNEIDVIRLRNFVAEAFEWTRISGAKKFIRSLVPALLVNKFHRRSNTERDTDNLNIIANQESALIKEVHDRRMHHSTDGLPELRVSCIPASLVGLDLKTEEPDDERVEDTSDSEPTNNADRRRSRSPSKSSRSTYDPTRPVKMWIAESFVKAGVPLVAENWEESLRDLNQFATRKARERTATAKGGMQRGAIDKYFKISKTAVTQEPSNRYDSISALPLSPVETEANTQHLISSDTKIATYKSRAKLQSKGTPKKKPMNDASSIADHSMLYSADFTTTPWTLAKRLSETDVATLHPCTRHPALGVADATWSKALIDLTDDGNTRMMLLSTTTSQHTDSKHGNAPTDNADAQSNFADVVALRSAHVPRRVGDSNMQYISRSEKPQPRAHLLRVEREVPPKMLDPKTSKFENSKTPVRDPDKAQLRENPISDNQNVTQTVNIYSPTLMTESAPASPLPSPSQLLLSSSSQCPAQSSSCTSLTTKAGLVPNTVLDHMKRSTSLRDSLEGTWRNVQLNEGKGGHTERVYDVVDIIDLTED